MQTPAALLASVLFLCSCGGNDAAAAPDDPAIPDADAAAAAPPVELTDELMEQYLVIAKEAKAVGDAGGFAFLTRHHWSIERWSQVSAAVMQGMMSASLAQVGDAVATSVLEMDKQIKDLEAQLKSAPEDDRAGLQMQLDAVRTGRDQIGAMTGKVTDLDRRNAATLQRWMPKLEEVSKTK